jgi:hypothetical protein
VCVRKKVQIVKAMFPVVVVLINVAVLACITVAVLNAKTIAMKGIYTLLLMGNANIRIAKRELQITVALMLVGVSATSLMGSVFSSVLQAILIQVENVNQPIALHINQQMSLRVEAVDVLLLVKVNVRRVV